MLLVQNGAGATVEIPPQVYTYHWTGSGMTAAVRGSRSYMKLIWERFAPEHRPTLLLHGSPEGFTSQAFPRLVRDARALYPDVRLAVGIAGDGTLKEWREGRISGEKVISRLVRAARAIEQVEPRALVVEDYEQAWKNRDNDARSFAEHTQLACDVVCAIALACGSLVQAITSYDHPTFHTSFPYAGFTVNTMVRLFFDQRYTDDGTPDKGAIPARERSADASQAAAERRGMIPPDVVPDVPHDVDRVHIYQLHGQHEGDLAHALTEHEHAAAWCLPLRSAGGRSDEAGLRSLLAALSMRAVAGSGSGAVKRFQQATGLAADGIVGPLTLAKAIEQA